MTDWTPVHPQVMTGRGFEVDEKIAALLEALWAQGIDTRFSCQGGEGKDAHICFQQHRDAVRFACGDHLRQDGRWVDFDAHHINSLTELWSPHSSH